MSIRLFLASCVASGLCTLAYAEGQTATTTLDAYGRAQAFLQALYPHLAKPGRVVTVNAGRWEPFDAAPHRLRAIVMTVEDPQDDSPPRPLLTARIEFAPDGALLQYLASGSALNETTTQRFQSWVADHRGSSLAEISSFLQEEKARFGPAAADAMRKEAVRQLRSIEPLIGRVTLRELEFLWDDLPTWRAEIVIVTRHGTDRYGVLFEPFDGLLTSMSGLN